MKKEASLQITAFSLLGIFFTIVITFLYNCSSGKSSYHSAKDTPVPVQPVITKVIDTIETIVIHSPDGQKAELDKTSNPHMAHLLFQGYGTISYQADVINDWENIYRFKRTKSPYFISYEKLAVMPQIRSTSFINKTENSVDFHISYTHKIESVKCYINGRLYKQFSPGSYEIEKPEEYLFEQMWKIGPLQKNKIYSLQVFVRFDGGAIDALDTVKFSI